MIEFSHLNKTFVSRAGKVEALKDVSLTVENGDIYGVIGFSGAGKSTLIRMANLLERPDSGSIKVDGVELTGQTEAQLIPVRRKIGMVFQQFNLLESRTVAQNIEIPMKLAGIASEQRAARVKELLQFVELSDKANTYVRSSAWASPVRWPSRLPSCCATKPPALWTPRPPSPSSPC